MTLTLEVCPLCGEGPLHEITRDRHLTISGTPVIVRDDVISKCDNCEELFYTGNQAKVADRRATDARRRAEGLLTSEEVKQVRHALALTQSQLEAALGVGPKTVVRWENGTAVQSTALDDVLRLIAFDPDNLRLLVRIRHAALSTTVNQRLINRDLSKIAELRTAIYATLEGFDFSEEETARFVPAIVKAIRTFKKDKMNRMVSEAEAALA